MRVLLLATPQSQLLGTGAGEEVTVTVTPSVVLVVVGVVGARDINIKLHFNYCHVLFILFLLTIDLLPLGKEAR